MKPIESGEETIQRFLSCYEIAAKLKTLRLKKKIGLADLGKHTGLSASLLSQLETGKAVPTLATLARIAMVFEVGIEYFFLSQRKQRLFAIVRPEQRMRFPSKPGISDPPYFFECLAYPVMGKEMQAYLAEFPESGEASPQFHEHPGFELIYVTEGTLELFYENAWHSLAAGDSVYMDSAEPHAYRGQGSAGAKALVFTLPPHS
ncbi:MAG: helix-turn-helix domain-containing protein [Acidobacteria bacterium]|nr:helix-turn-helix domain-containing protein [Acidobacteriota bacterium]